MTSTTAMAKFIRSFSYTDGVMTRHSNALGLDCYYRWETIDGQPRVVEHWTSDGEHYHYRYDFKQRTSWAVDVLGRELEVRTTKTVASLPAVIAVANTTPSISTKTAI
ncbi:hypothetical protein [Pseudomonas syringae]